MLNKFNEVFNQGNKAAYIKIIDKVRIDKHFYKLDQVKDMKTLAYWVQSGLVVVDVDDNKSAKIMYKLVKDLGIRCGICKTKKGIHLIFKQNTKYPVKTQNVKVKNALTIEFDFRLELKGYIVLPQNDPLRKWIHIPDSLDEVDEIPNIFLAQKSPALTKQFPESFVNLTQGSRNDTMFRYFMQLLDHGQFLSPIAKQDVLRKINNYVLPNPLDEMELENTVLRQELIENLGVVDDDEEKNNILETLANKVLKNYTIITKMDKMYVFETGFYKPLCDKDLHSIIHEEYSKNLDERKRSEIIKFIKVKTNIRQGVLNDDVVTINLRNVRLNIKDMTTSSHSEDFYDTIQIPHEYNPNAKPSETLKGFLRFICNTGDKETSKEKLQLVLEMIGACFLKKTYLDKMFMLLGGGKNGKSTFIEILMKLLGENNIATEDLSSFSNNKFAGSSLIDKIANIGDDMKSGALEDTGVIKSLTSGKPITIEGKFKDAQQGFRNMATFIYAANKLPFSNDKSNGFYRRFIIINFDNIVKEEDINPNLFNEIVEEDYEWLLYNSIKAFSGVMATNEFTITDEMDKALDAFKEQNSPVLRFMAICNLKRESLVGKQCRELYMQFKDFCDESNLKRISEPFFDEELIKEFDVVKVRRRVGGKNAVLRWFLSETELSDED